jgi:hypothetical protein
VSNRECAPSLRMVRTLLDGRRIPHGSLLAGVRSDTSAAMTPPTFCRYFGIHCAGAETPDSGLQGMRVCSATTETPPQEVRPPPELRKYRTHRALAHWPGRELRGDVPVIGGHRHAVGHQRRLHRIRDLPRGADAHNREYRRRTAGESQQADRPGAKNHHLEPRCRRRSSNEGAQSGSPGGEGHSLRSRPRRLKVCAASAV